MFHVKQSTDNLYFQLKEYNKILGFPEFFLQASAQFLGYLLEYNEKVNLISRQDERNIVDHHWLHCVVGLKLPVWKEAAKVLDIGSGGGFPGILIALADQKRQVVLVESIGKKSRFLHWVSRELGLANVTVIRDRVENIRHIPPQDMVTARAVASLYQLVRWGFPLLKPGGYLMAWKGYCEQELLELKKASSEIQKIDQIKNEFFTDIERLKTLQMILVKKR